ncbi:MAG: proline dehydrogenase family protein [Planctomycetes bacterium]|nr:proline dehydrogenase family protein [Planctomycetota bacterium]
MNPIDRLFALGLPFVPKPVMKKLGGRYVAGQNRAHAIELGRRLSQHGYRLTFDVLGEAVSDEAGVQEALHEYQGLFEDLQTAELELNLSLKPTQMGLCINENHCLHSVRTVLTPAAAAGGFVRFEMEDSPTTDGTLRVFKELREEFGSRVGCVLQSMLMRTQDDVASLLDSDASLNVRMVKGIYLEPSDIAFQDPQKVRESYMTATQELLDGGAFVGAATHDSAIVHGLVDLLQKNPGWKERVEVQMLLGVQEDLRTQVRELDIPVRVYVPYGEHWMPYVLRRLKKNPTLAKHAFMGLFKRKEELGS